jgi:tetratricopeptide (TPR) repeat protein
LGDDCGNPFRNGVGPYDYNDQAARTDPSKIPIVEAGHFTSKVERLVEGESQANPAGDIDYTLRAIPNHHRALYAISRYELRFGASRWKTAKCYFDRAVVFRPEDPTVRMLLGLHYAMRDNHEQALSAYREAESLMPDNPELQYNLGLTLIELGEYDAAREAAIRAYDGGYPLPGLRRKLNDLGYGWE